MFADVSFFPAAILLVVSYLIGSIPSTLIAARITADVDLRDFGSGNAGGTNAFRVLGPVRGAISGLADAAKGFVCAAFLAPFWFDTGGDTGLWQVAAGSAAVLGHVWPVWASFRGGKGVATTIGMLVAVDLPAAAGFACIGLVFALFTRYVSVGSLAASILLPLLLIGESNLFGRDIGSALIVFGVTLPLLIVFTHRGNIERLSSGVELKLGHRVDIEAQD